MGVVRLLVPDHRGAEVEVEAAEVEAARVEAVGRRARTGVRAGVVDARVVAVGVDEGLQDEDSQLLEEEQSFGLDASLFTSGLNLSLFCFFGSNCVGRCRSA